jgi:hypothetical protein
VNGVSGNSDWSNQVLSSFNNSTEQLWNTQEMKILNKRGKLLFALCEMIMSSNGLGNLQEVY